MKAHSNFSLTLMFCFIMIVSFSQPYVVKHGMTSSALLSQLTTQFNKGYKLISMNTYKSSGTTQYFAHWEKATGFSQYFHVGITEADFNSKHASYQSQGFQLSHFAVDYIDGVKKFIGIWNKRSGITILKKHDMSPSAYQTEFNNQLKNGYRIVHLHAYTNYNDVYYAAIWEKPTVAVPITTVARHGLTSALFQKQFDSLKIKGYAISKVTGYNINGIDYFSGIWDKNTYSNDHFQCGVSLASFLPKIDNLKYQGYIPKFVSVYGSGTYCKFNYLWSNSHISSSDLSRIDISMMGLLNLNGDYTKLKGGLSIAITRRGKLIFAKGYGYSNNVSAIPLSPNHSMRVMSISKTLTAVAIYQLIKKYPTKIGLDKKVFGTSSILGTSLLQNVADSNKTKFYQVTVRQLLNHTSGLVSCNGESEFYSGTSSFDAALQTILKKPDVFVFKPNTNYNYSNTGFMILHKIIDVLEPTLKYENFVKRNILVPSGIDTTRFFLGLADGTSKSVEVNYYPAMNKNMKLYGGFGGWVARPMDLLRYLLRVDGIAREPDILDAVTRDSMLKESIISKKQGRSYAQGWIVQTFPLQWHNGSGGSGPTRSWMMKLDSVYSVALNINYLPTSFPSGNTSPTLENQYFDRITKIIYGGALTGNLSLLPVKFSDIDLFDPSTGAVQAIASTDSYSESIDTEISDGLVTSMIYPNPSNDGFFHLQNIDEQSSVTIVDMLGREEQREVKNGLFSTTMRGTLLVKIETSRGVKVLRVFVKPE